MSAKRDIEMAEKLIRKADSTLEYSCFSFEPAGAVPDSGAEYGSGEERPGGLRTSAEIMADIEFYRSAYRPLYCLEYGEVKEPPFSMYYAPYRAFVRIYTARRAQVARMLGEMISSGAEDDNDDNCLTGSNGAAAQWIKEQLDEAAADYTAPFIGGSHPYVRSFELLEPVLETLITNLTLEYNEAKFWEEYLEYEPLEPEGDGYVVPEVSRFGLGGYPGGASTCIDMAGVWELLQCRDFSMVDFVTFSGLRSFDPRIEAPACSEDGRSSKWSDRVSAAAPPAGSSEPGAADAVLTYLDRMSWAVVDECDDLEPVPSGVMVRYLAGSDDSPEWREYPDKMCSLPGCYFDPGDSLSSEGDDKCSTGGDAPPTVDDL